MNTAEPSTTPRATHHRLLRLKQVLELFPLSRSSWYRGIANGHFPRPVRLGERAVAWREADILALIRASGDTK